jgi:hypothetical protein
MISTVNNIIIISSIIGIFAGFVVLILDLFKRLVKKEKISILIIFLFSFLTRFLWGSFSPWRQHEHYFDVFSILKHNFLNGAFLGVDRTYRASVGLFENFYNIPLQFFPEFNVYVVYYTSLTLMLFCGLFVFLLALNLFKNKKIAFISYLIFSFLPILIKISASEIYFILNGFTLLLFVNYLFYLRKRNKISTWHYVLLLLLLFSNLVGRLEYLSFFPILIFSLLAISLIFNKNLRAYLKKNNKIKIILLLFLATSLFYFVYYIYPVGSRGGELAYRIHKFTNLKDQFNSLLYTDYNTPARHLFLRSFFTPLYFFILTLITPLMLIIKRKWKVLTVLGFTIPFVMFYATSDFVDFRRILPLLLLFIPFISWTFYLLIKKIKIPQKYIFILAVLIITLSPLQNIEFLKAETGRKAEQDFLIKNLKKIPKNSLILTVNDPLDDRYKFGYPSSKNEYFYTQETAVFNTYLLPKNKNIKVMDINTQYDSKIIESYENVFYYRSLYSYHERSFNFYPQKNKKKTPWQATKEFEKNKKLKPIEEKMVKNSLYNIKTVRQFKEGYNLSIKAKGILKIGLYKLKGI